MSIRGDSSRPAAARDRAASREAAARDIGHEAPGGEADRTGSIIVAAAVIQLRPRGQVELSEVAFGRMDMRVKT